MNEKEYNELFLAHYGIKGQHWGVRRYQNYDGTLTAAGRARYIDGEYERESEYNSQKNNFGASSGGYNERTQERIDQIRVERAVENLKKLPREKKEIDVIRTAKKFEKAMESIGANFQEYYNIGMDMIVNHFKAKAAKKKDERRRETEGKMILIKAGLWKK